MSADRDRDLLEMVSGFWFGRADRPAPEVLRGVVSNIYAVPGASPDDSPLTIVGFDFKDDSEAKKRERQLQQKFQGSAQHRVAKRGLLVIAMNFRPPVSEICAADVWFAVLDKMSTDNL
jgi:hypothetical protein